MNQPQLEINLQRLKNDIESLSLIGRSADLGIYRTAFSGNDMLARDWLKERITDAGLHYELDGAANIHAVFNADVNKPSVMTGSHIDTVPGAGHLDGALGVICGLECLRVLKEQNLMTDFPVELVAFSDEEGTFSGMFGSQALTGEISPEWIHNACSSEGLSLVDAMARHGLDAMQALSAARPASSLKAYVELHIEQGPVLDSQSVSIGVVEGICGLQRWQIKLIGHPNHAGTTPMAMRQDALQGMVEFSSQINRVLEEHGSNQSVATIGKVEVLPGAPNVIPGEVNFTLEFRELNETKLNELADAFLLSLSTITHRRQLNFDYQVVSNIAPVSCDSALMELIAETSQQLSLSSLKLPSGAAHDAQKLARITRAAMIFVPSKAGRSHSAAEWTSWNDIHAGANVLLNTLYKIACEKTDG